MGLNEYKRKRHFQRTPEPAGSKTVEGGRSFVIQKHSARRLHYDFRLELDGVLKSWAVPKGPSLDPSIKRLAMHVEDHPVEYGDFEGVIPRGEYGGGTVLLWDRGVWEPIGDAHEGYRTGKLKFKLHGEKLRGRWMLVRTKGSEGAKQAWLLFKERDEEARPAGKGDILDEKPLSVDSGKDLEQIAADRGRVWSSAARRDGAAQQASRRSLISLAEEYDARKKQFAGVRLTSPEKILYPEREITKIELAAYYRDMAEWILPHLADRPLVLVRCPEGRAKECFFQKHPRVGTPGELRQIDIHESDGTEKFVVVDDVRGLTSLAQISVLEIHAWGSRTDRLDRPDRLIFDLDPDESVPWADVATRARQVGQFLEDLGLVSFIKTTGGKGLHLVVPIERRHAWEEVKAFCKSVADAVVTADPRHFTANMSKAARPGKIYIDYLRNTRGATAVQPYSPRARSGAPVSVPLTWKELSPHVPSDHYNIRNLAKRLSSLKHDPWEEVASTRQSLAGPLKKLRGLGRA